MLAATGWTVRRLLLAIGLVSTAGACTLLSSLDEYGPGKAGTDAGRDAPGSTGEAGAATCTHAEPSAKPAQDDGTQSLKVVFALDRLYLGTPPDAGAGTVIGWDLDNVCTCPGPASCNAAPTSKNHGCDAPNGIDNSGAELLQTVILSSGSDGNANAAIADGSKGLLVQIAGYNGGENDTDLQVTFFATGGTEVDGDGNHVAPQHNGSDPWTVRKDSLFGGDGAGPNYIGAYRDDHAWVSGGQLVAHVDFPLSFGNIDATLTDTVVTARIVANGSRYRLEDGRFVGRWLTSNLLTALDSVADPLVEGGGLCGSSPVYQELKSEICAAADLRGRASEDGKSPLLDCDALGMVMSFTAETAVLGTAVDKTPPVHHCGAGYSDACPAF